MMEHKGHTIERTEAVNVGYAPDRHNKKTHTLTKRTRKVKGYVVTGPGLLGEKWCDTLKEAKQYVNGLL